MSEKTDMSWSSFAVASPLGGGVLAWLSRPVSWKSGVSFPVGDDDVVESVWFRTSW